MKLAFETPDGFRFIADTDDVAVIATIGGSAVSDALPAVHEKREPDEFRFTVPLFGLAAADVERLKGQTVVVLLVEMDDAT